MSECPIYKYNIYLQNQREEESQIEIITHLYVNL